MQYEANVRKLRIEFDEDWENYVKTVTFWNAMMENPVKRILANDLLEGGSTLVYIVPIPGEALTEAGEMTFVIDGYSEEPYGKRKRSVSGTLWVNEAPFEADADEPSDPTPSQAEQLQRQINTIAAVTGDAVLNTPQALTNEQKAQARENIGAASVDIIGGSTTLSASDFVNGVQTIGQGIVAGDYNITLATPVPVKVGDKIDIKPNGMVVSFQIESVDDFADVVTHLKNQNNITTDIEYISEYDGFCFISVRDTGWGKVTPESYVCDITIGSGDRITKLEEQMAEAGDRMDNIEKTIPAARLVSPKHKPYTRIVNDCQDASKWTITNNSTAITSVDTTDFIIGTQSLRSDKQMRCYKDVWDMLNNDLVVKFRINSIAKGAKLLLSIAHLATPSSRLVYELARGSDWTTPTDWQEIAIPYAAYPAAYEGNASVFDFSKVEDLIFMASEGAVDWNLQYVGLRPKALSNGIVTFTFDDGYKSQYTGIKALAEKGITGTIFHIKESTGTNDYMTTTDLQELVNWYGADIEVHGDPSYDQWDEADLVEHWENSQKWLKENGLGDGKHMAYPNGIFPENVVQLAKGYFDSCRTIIPFIPIEAYPLADRYRVRAVSGVGAYSATVDNVKSYIDKTVLSGGWLILVFHKIGDGTDSMWCSEADLKAIADYAISSGAHIMNYAEAFECVAMR